MSHTNNKKDSSHENNDAPESLKQNLLNDKVVKILLAIGLVLIMFNIIVAFFIDTKPNALLFYINMYYWPVYTSAALWAIAIWVVSRSIESLEDYMPAINVFVTACILLAVIFSLQSNNHAGFTWYSLCFNIFIIATVICTVRSLFLFYDYWYKDGISIDMEESKWFWGMSCILIVVFSIAGIMNLIILQVPAYEGSSSFVSTPLYQIYRDSMLVFMQTGQGPAGIQAVAFLMFVISITFIYTAGMWTLLMLSRFR